MRRALLAGSLALLALASTRSLPLEAYSPLPIFPGGLPMHLTNAYGVPGTHVVLDATGFQPGETVNLSFNTTPLTSVTADSKGAFSNLKATIPQGASFTVAENDLVALGSSSGRGARVIFVIAAPAIYGPQMGAGGMAANLSVSGLKPGEVTTIHWGSGSGPSLGNATADDRGDASNLVVTIPMGASAGVSSLVAVGNQGTTLSTPFRVQPALLILHQATVAGALVDGTLLGFRPAETVSVSWGSTVLRPVNTDASGGALSFILQLPPTARGATQIVASDGSRAAVAPLNLQPGLALHPPQARAGTALTVTGTGFAPNEQVTLSWQASSASPTQVSADSNGDFSGSITVPLDYAPGSHTLLATAPSGHSFSASLRVATDWPKLGGDLQHSGTNGGETLLSAANVAGLHVLWQRQGLGAVPGSLAFYHGAVYEGDIHGDVSALDGITGALRWQFNAPSPQYTITASPTIADGLVFIDANIDRAEGQPGPSPLYALDASTGAVRWMARLPSFGWGSPTVVNGMVYVGTSQSLLAFDESTGTPRWQTPVSVGVWSSPTFGSQSSIFYIGMGDPADSVVSVNAMTGTANWSKYAPPNGPDQDVGAVPAYADGQVFIGSKNGHVYSLDASTGTPRWDAYLSNTDPGVLSAAAIHAGQVFVGDSAGVVYGLDETSGKVNWQTSIGGYVWGSPVVANGVVYVGKNDTQLGDTGATYALDEKTGAVLWSAQPGAVDGSEVVADGVLYVGSIKGTVTAYGLAQVPAPAQPLNSMGGATLQNNTFSCTWSAVGGASGYGLELLSAAPANTVPEPDPSRIGSASTSATSWPCNSSGLAAGKYWWRVVAWDASGFLGGFGATDSFTVPKESLTVDTSNPRQPLFSWQSFSSATSYGLELLSAGTTPQQPNGTSADPNRLAVGVTQAPVTTWQGSTAGLAPGTYAARVIAWNGSGFIGGFSDPVTFPVGP
jgi:outer membrane protein assembly factor BamB